MGTPRYPYESATKAERRIGRFWWCVHHSVLCEPLTEPIEERVAYIRKEKPANEIETRLRALRPLRGKLPRAVERADAARAKADAAWEKTNAALEKTYVVLDKAYADHADEILALFHKECPDVRWEPGTGLVFEKEAR